MTAEDITIIAEKRDITEIEAIELDFDNLRLLSDCSDEDKIKWFDEFYGMAKEYANEDNKYNRKVYESMFINVAEDIVKHKKPFRIYEFQGVVVMNDYALSEGESE